MGQIPVSEIMSTDLVTIASTETAEKAAKLMKARKVGSILVFDSEKPAGIITERDLVRCVMSEGKDPRSVKIREIMSKPLITVGIDAEINEIAEMMSRKNVHKFPVMSGGKIVGIVTDHDILKIEPDLVELLQEKERRMDEGSFPLIPTKRGVRGICELCENYSGEMEEVNGCWVCPVCKEEMAQ